MTDSAQDKSTMENETAAENAGRKKTVRGFALAAAVILILMFLATLLVALFGGQNSKRLLTALIFADVAVPVVLYGYALLTKQLRKK